MVRPKPLDILVFCVALVVIGLIAAKVYIAGTGKSVIHVKSSSQEWIFPLEKPRIFSVEGPLGETTLEIKNGSLRVIASPCQEKICIKTGSISRPGHWIACLPNNIFITIKGKGEKQIDAFSF